MIAAEAITTIPASRSTWRAHRITPSTIRGSATRSSGAAASSAEKNSHDGSQNPQYSDARVPSVLGLMSAWNPAIGLRACAARITHRPNVSA